MGRNGNGIIFWGLSMDELMNEDLASGVKIRGCKFNDMCSCETERRWRWKRA